METVNSLFLDYLKKHPILFTSLLLFIDVTLYNQVYGIEPKTTGTNVVNQINTLFPHRAVNAQYFNYEGPTTKSAD